MPMIGDSVWFYPYTHGERGENPEPWAAIVTAIDDRERGLVSLAVFTPGGVAQCAGRIPPWTGTDEGRPSHAHWVDRPNRYRGVADPKSEAASSVQRAVAARLNEQNGNTTMPQAGVQPLASNQQASPTVEQKSGEGAAQKLNPFGEPL